MEPQFVHDCEHDTYLGSTTLPRPEGGTVDLYASISDGRFDPVIVVRTGDAYSDEGDPVSSRLPEHEYWAIEDGDVEFGARLLSVLYWADKEGRIVALEHIIADLKGAGE